MEGTGGRWKRLEGRAEEMGWKWLVKDMNVTLMLHSEVPGGAVVFESLKGYLHPSSSFQ